MNTFLLTATGLLCGYAIGAAVTAVFYECQIAKGYVAEAEGYEDEGDTSSTAGDAGGASPSPTDIGEPKYEVLTDEDWEVIDEICADELASAD